MSRLQRVGRFTLIAMGVLILVGSLAMIFAGGGK